MTRKRVIEFAAVTITFFLLFSTARATTWSEGSKKDPFSAGTCNAPQIVIWGGYVYAWPSKYDVVYWPFIDANWLWYCSKSGYVSFGNEFDNLSGSERDSIASFLSNSYRGGVEN